MSFLNIKTPENIENFFARNLPRPQWCSHNTKKTSKFFEDAITEIPDSDQLSDSGISREDITPKWSNLKKKWKK